MMRKAFMLGVVVAAMAAGAEAVSIDADSEGFTTAPLTAGQWYTIEAKGVYGYSESWWPEKIADAEWARVRINDTWQWVESPSGGDLDLYVNDRDISMMGTLDGEAFSQHVYSPSHVYRANVLGQGLGIKLSIYDRVPHDNIGHLNVTVTPGWQDVTIVPQMGDTNGDGAIDERDYENLVEQFGGPPGDESADSNGDGIVDLDDFAAQRANFGLGVASPRAGESGATIPEPATLILMAAGLPLLLKRKRLGLSGGRFALSCRM